MSYNDCNRIIWNQSRALSHAYWAQYQRLIGPLSTITSTTQPDTYCDETQGSNYSKRLNKETDSETDPDIALDFDLQHEESEIDEEEEEEDFDVDDNEVLNSEYLEFIKITRQHQEERERLKLLERKTKPEFEEYYKDISQVNTLVEDNLVQAPNKKDLNQLSSARQQEDKLIELYGSREAYERIRSMEMCIDEHFNKKFQELVPQYWPVMPLNPKPYLNPIR